MKHEAKFTFELKGKDLDNRAAVAGLMARIQMSLDRYPLPNITDWRLDSFEG